MDLEIVNYLICVKLGKSYYKCRQSGFIQYFSQNKCRAMPENFKLLDLRIIIFWWRGYSQVVILTTATATATATAMPTSGRKFVVNSIFELIFNQPNATRSAKNWTIPAAST